MKEAFWGVLIVLLGLFGIVVVNVFQNVTVDNDRVYYLIKESTEAAAFDALDLSYYRLTGDLRIVEDKFVENLTRRFAENVTIGDYTIIVEDINELPPKISLRVRSGITSLKGEEFGIVNRVDAILETKYSLDEVLEFLDITKEEWEELKDPEKEEDENVCQSVHFDEKLECMPGDLKFTGFKEVSLQNAVCQDENPNQNVGREAEYKICECGKWKDEIETITANPVRVGNEWKYTWTFNKTGEIRNISESISKRVPIQICTTAIEEMVPKDIHEVTPKEDGSSYEPSSDNSNYILCPPNGIRIPVGMKFTMHPNYIPPQSINRNLEWHVSDENILGIQNTNDTLDCILNEEGTNCFSKAVVTAKNVGITYVNVKTTRGQTATCKVEVFNGNIDSVSCENLTLQIGDSATLRYTFSPLNAINKDFTWTISNSNIATISGNYITAKSSGTATITIKENKSGKLGNCTITVPSPPPSTTPDDGDSGGGSSSSGGSSCQCCYNTSWVAPSGYMKNGRCVCNEGYPGSCVDISSPSYTPTLGTTKKTSTTKKATTKKSTTKKATTKKATTKKPSTGTCLAQGTKIRLANGMEKNIENITYNDLLMVWNYETGSYTYEYPIWIEKEGKTNSYIRIEFIDGTYLDVVNDHGIYDLEKNLFVNVNDLKKGSKVAKIIDGKIYEAIVHSISIVEEDVNYYHVVSTRFYNIIANNILTTDDMVILSNLYGFTNDISWKNKNYTELQLYKYNEFDDFLPYYLFKGLRVEEGKVLEKYIDKNTFKMYLMNNQMNPDLIKTPETNLLGKRMWMVTTSEDKVNSINSYKYLKEEMSKYVIPMPKKKSKFKNWYNTSDGKYYKPGDVIIVDTGIHLVADYE